MAEQQGPGPSTPVFECLRLSKSFGGIAALRDVSLTINAGEVVGLVGSNGAGKTTLLNILTGILPHDGGILQIFGRRITSASPAVMASLGIARTFQRVRLFRGLDVAENVRVAMPTDGRWNLWSALIRPETERRVERQERQEAKALLGEVGLGSQLNRPIGSLTDGERRLVEVARALAQRPRVLLLDEPAAGLTLQEESMLAGVFRRLARDRAMALLVVEHRWRLLEECATRVLWLEEGRVRDEDCPTMILNSIRSGPP